MNKITIMGTICLLSSLVFTGTIIANSKSNDVTGLVTASKPISPEREAQLNTSVTVIHTKFGEFKRISSAQFFAAPEIAYDSLKTTTVTKQIVTDYGVFIKDSL